ncbi:MAG: tRNA (adenosine(37)-N6)-threonylcarbamoyltransferase complex ATPase subunit type 1 TsaE [Desulfovibrionales bacterium]
MLVYLDTTEATLKFGRLIAEAILKSGRKNQPILLQGDLGSGKTTFTRGVVAALPGGDDAEVSSPSFNIFNVYPTFPETVHFDLYRLEHAEPEENLLEYFASPDHLVIVEWIEYLPEPYWPDDFLILVWRTKKQGREVFLKTRGEKSERLMHILKPGINAEFTE